MAVLSPDAFEKVAYLGYGIVIREHDLTILDPQGRKLARERWQLSTARAFIRRYRKGK